MSCDRCNEERAKHNRYCSYCGTDLSVPNGGAPCQFCSRSKSMGHHFCNVCGRDLSNDPSTYDVCPGCQEYRDAGYRFCAICGRSLRSQQGVVPAFQRKGDGPRIPLILMTFSVLLGVGILIYEAFAGIVKIPYLMDAVEGLHFWLFIITPEVTDILELNDTGIRILYIAELIAVLCSIAYLIYSAVMKALTSKDGIASIQETGLYEAICLNGLLFLFQMAYVMICMANGVDIDSVEFGDVAESMIALMNASVYEELLCRVMMLGLPIGIICILAKKKDVPAYRYLLGGFGFKGWMWVFVLLSAGFFAAGHLSGWGLWKLIPTFLFGLMTAYLFIKYGLYATISIHFLTDFIMAETWVTGSDMSVTLAMMMFFSALLALGCIPTYYRRMREVLSNLSTKKE